MANKSGIHINPKHKGEFTKKAKAAGMSVQAFAKHVHAHPDNYSPKTRKQAGFAGAAAKFKHQAGGYQPDIENTNPGMNPIQANDPNNPTFNFMDNITPYAEPGGPQQQPQMPPQQGGRYRLPPRMGESPIVNTFNGAASIVTALGNVIQNGKQNRNDRQRFLQGITPRYMQNMEGAGLNQGPAYTMYGGNSDRATDYGGGMHGEGGTEGIQNHTTGPNFRQYSRGIDSDTADMRTEGDVPVAGKPGKMPRRYKAGGGTTDNPVELTEMMFGGADFGVPRSYSDMDNEDYGYAGVAHNAFYGQNSVYRNGGEVSPDKAKEILKDGTANGKTLTDRQRRYFGWLAGGAKAQTGGPAPDPSQLTPPPAQQQAQPQQQQGQLGPEDYYKASATLSYYKDKLNAQLKQKNPQAYGDYFKGLVDQRKAGNVKGAQDYVQNSQYNEYLSPDEVKKTLGSDKDYDNYLNSIKQVNAHNVAQGQQPLYGNIEGQNDPSQLNYGRRFASLQVTPSFGKTVQGGSTGDKHYNRNYQYNPNTGQVDFSEVGDTSIRPEGWAAPQQQQQLAVAARQTGGYTDHSQIPAPPKRREPIYVNKPNDPRLQRYNDSMTLYNSHKEYQRRLPEVLKHGEENNYKGNDDFVDWAASVDDVADPAYQRLYDYNGQLPGTISKDGYRTFAIRKDKNGAVVRQRVNDIAIDRPKQEIIYGKPPIPKPKPELKPSKITSKLAEMEEPIQVKGSQLTPADVSQKPTKFSFTGRDENGQQITRYFQDLESWKAATDAAGYSNREIGDNGSSANATGYQFKMGGRKYQVGGKTSGSTAGQGFAIGDEIEMSAIQIAALKKQGYKFEDC